MQDITSCLWTSDGHLINVGSSFPISVILGPPRAKVEKNPRFLFQKAKNSYKTFLHIFLATLRIIISRNHWDHFFNPFILWTGLTSKATPRAWNKPGPKPGPKPDLWARTLSIGTSTFFFVWNSAQETKSTLQCSL